MSAPDGGGTPPAASADGGLPTPRERCSAPEGVSNAPRSVLEFIELVNALERPVTIPCVLDVLARPLELNATMSIFSAQPAEGRDNPRIFLFYDPLIISIVPSGRGQHLVEFGELRGEDRSLKAEIEFPVVDHLDWEEAFDHLMFNESITTCAFCHADEVVDPELSEAVGFVSQALRPEPRDDVPLEEVALSHLLCDAAAEPDRCAMFDAIFSQGSVVARQFPETMKTFF